MASLLFGLTCIFVPTSWEVKQLSLMVFDKHAGNRLFPLSKLWVRSDNKPFQWGLLSELPIRPNSNNSLEMEFWGSSKPGLAPPVASTLLVFTATLVVRQPVFKGTIELKRTDGLEIRQVKTLWSLQFLLRYNYFS